MLVRPLAGALSPCVTAFAVPRLFASSYQTCVPVTVQEVQLDVQPSGFKFDWGPMEWLQATLFSLFAAIAFQGAHHCLSKPSKVNLKPTNEPKSREPHNLSTAQLWNTNRGDLMSLG